MSINANLLAESDQKVLDRCVSQARARLAKAEREAAKPERDAYERLNARVKGLVIEVLGEGTETASKRTKKITKDVMRLRVVTAEATDEFIKNEIMEEVKRGDRTCKAVLIFVLTFLALLLWNSWPSAS